jgi:hypothetical protein
VRQPGVWSDTTAGCEARTVSHIILREYVCDQERIAWSQLSMQSTGKTNTQHPSKLIVLPQPEDGLGRTFWTHTTLQQYHLLKVQNTLPQ